MKKCAGFARARERQRVPLCGALGIAEKPERDGRSGWWQRSTDRPHRRAAPRRLPAALARQESLHVTAHVGEASIVEGGPHHHGVCQQAVLGGLLRRRARASISATSAIVSSASARIACKYQRRVEDIEQLRRTAHGRAQLGGALVVLADLLRGETVNVAQCGPERQPQLELPAAPLVLRPAAAPPGQVRLRGSRSPRDWRSAGARRPPAAVK